jgi:hypothetical protein
MAIGRRWHGDLKKKTRKRGKYQGDASSNLGARRVERSLD